MYPKRPENFDNAVPGPGTYSPILSKTSGGVFSKTSRTPIKKVERGPGPGSYTV